MRRGVAAQTSQSTTAGANRDRGPARWRRQLAVLDRAGALPFRVAVRVLTPRREPRRRRSPIDAGLAARSIPIWLSVPGARPQRRCRALARRAAPPARSPRLGAHHSRSRDRRSGRRRSRAFAVRVASTEVRAVTGTAIRTRARRPPDETDRRASEIYTPELAPYVDLLAVPEAGIEAATAWLSRVDASASLAVIGRPDSVPAQGRHARHHRRGAAFCRHQGRHLQRRRRRGVTSALKSLAPAAALLDHEVEDLADPVLVSRLIDRRRGRDRDAAASPALRQPDVRDLSRLLGAAAGRDARGVDPADRRGHAGRLRSADRRRARRRACHARPRRGPTRAARAVDRRTDVRRLQRGAVDVYGERSGVTAEPHADGGRGDRPASGAAAHAGRARQELHRARAARSSTSVRPSPIPATTW